MHRYILPEGLEHEFTNTPCNITILLGLPLPGPRNGSFPQLQEVETYVSASFISFLATQCDVEKKFGGRFVAAVLPHSFENA